MREIAKKMGVSVATVSRALRADLSVRPEIRDAVRETAERMGYKWNPFVGDLMSSIRRSENDVFHGNLGIVRGPRSGFPSAAACAGIHEGASKRAEELGFSLSEFGPDSLQRTSFPRILANRGINGVFVLAPSFGARWKEYESAFAACVVVSVGCGIEDAGLNSVRPDYYTAVRIALEHACSSLGSGVAAVWSSESNALANRMPESAFVTHHPAGSAVACKLFVESHTLDPARWSQLAASHKVSALLVESRSLVPEWLEALIPPERQILFEDPCGAAAEAWVDPGHACAGSVAVEVLAACLARNEAGTRRTLLIPPVLTTPGS